ncbi:hypothetical protein M2152_002316 [Microbacteriaceae bacterium SG_E_30_P1]|uniref:Lipoprotein n=1 Tax=Antiquaquibacter oligotrophicus TaxID=2880260 RepID=A0ABT6KQL5_9MICO|nr:hypothetical protein [Antiquaquibacter oligotrophicus]MDH6182134.1 hypothetical protein [Antiquaquibacter oligotrophicus]UDF12203.1 hypothetical protein LH407_08490 [Antiquaquibacter oligotrophicus]
MKTRWFAAAALALPLLLAGCVGGAVTNYQGEPEQFAGEPGGDADSGLQAFWLQEGAQLAITLSGSSGCPYIVTSITVLEKAGEGNRISAEVPPIPEDKACTMDFVPHTTVFSTPGEVTTTEPLTIEVMDSEIVLPIK